MLAEEKRKYILALSLSIILLFFLLNGLFKVEIANYYNNESRNQLASAEGGVSNTIVVHVSLNGNDANDGSSGSPVATISKAVTLIDSDTNANGEIIFHGGVYRDLAFEILPAEAYNPSKTFNENRTLVIKPNSGDEVTFDGGIPLSQLNPKPLDGYPGVYTISGDFMVDTIKGEIRPPDVWEEGARVRYKQVASLEGAKFEDYTTVLIDRNTVGIHSNGTSFNPANIMVSSKRTAMIIRRPNVTISGLKYRNYMGHRWANAVNLLSYNNTLENCYIYNSYNGILGGNSRADKPNRINNCEIVDTGTGLYANLGGWIVENSKIVNSGGRFYIHEMEAENRSGVMFYHLVTNGTVRNNLIKGFANNCIRKKTSAGEFVFEHNTLLSCETAGIASREWTDRDRIRYNIIADSKDSVLPQSSLVSGVLISKNLFWHTDSQYQTLLRNRVQEFESYGGGNVVDDPKFVSSDRSNYLLLPSSVAVTLSDDGKPAGAFPIDSSQVSNVPNLTINLVEDSLSVVRDQNNIGQYIAKKRDISVNLVASALDPIVGVKISVEGDLDKTSRFQVVTDQNKTALIAQADTYIGSFHTIEKIVLPDFNQKYKIIVSVKDSRNNWSAQKELVVSYSNSGPTINKHYIYANKYRVLMYFETDRQSEGVFRYYKNGKENISTIGAPGSTAAGLVVEPNSNYTYRLTVTDSFGSKTVIEGAFNTNAEPRTMFVSPQGQDLEENGDRSRPFKTIAFATRRLLPGDTLKIEPGYYFESINVKWGGVEGHPITIESAVPYAAVIDGLKKLDRGINIIGSPYTVLNGLRIQWFKKTMINIGSSPNSKVIGCYLVNANSDGSVNAGDGITIAGSDNVQVSSSVIKGLGTGLQLFKTSNANIYNNTFISNRSSVFFLEPFEGAEVKYNLFFASSIQSFSADTMNLDSIKRLEINFNNYAGRIRENDPEPPDTFIDLPQPFSTRSSKHHVVVLGREFDRLDRWQEFSGQDKNSIVANPLFVDPTKDRFDLQSNSPNLLSNGKIIGAFGYLSSASNPLDSSPPPPAAGDIPEVFPERDSGIDIPFNPDLPITNRPAQDNPTPTNNTVASDSASNPVVRTPPLDLRSLYVVPGTKPKPEDYPPLPLSTSTIDINLPPLPSWIDAIESLVADLAGKVVSGIKNTVDLVKSNF